jgi:hypothetical protein
MTVSCKMTSEWLILTNQDIHHTRLLGSRDLHYCHIDSYRPNSVSTETKFK